MRRGASIACLVMVLALSPAAPVAPATPATASVEPPLVAAAASLRHVFPELTRVWTDGGGVPPRVSFGSSGNLYRQIAQGAPFDLFLSADEAQALKLVRAGRTDGEGLVYGVGRLALLVPRHSRLALDASLGDLGRALDDGRLRRLAIANPAHAPYGHAAREALVRAALWPRLDGRLLLAENAAQAVQFALVRGADGGLVPSALALAKHVSSKARHVLLDTSMHPPLTQRMVLLAPAGEEARALFRFLAGPAARRIFERFGFTTPERESAVSRVLAPRPGERYGRASAARGVFERSGSTAPERESAVSRVLAPRSGERYGRAPALAVRSRPRDGSRATSRPRRNTAIRRIARSGESRTPAGGTA